MSLGLWPGDFCTHPAQARGLRCPSLSRLTDLREERGFLEKS